MSLVRAAIGMVRGVPMLLSQERDATDADLFALDLALTEALDAVSEHIAVRHPDPVRRAVEGAGHTIPLIINGDAP